MTMQTILAIEAGGFEVLQLHELDIPELQSARHLRVKLAAAGVNPLDAKLRKQAIYYPDQLPAILGCDGAGVVDAVGEEVTRFKVGEQVYFNNGGIGLEPGCYAEYTTLHEDFCALKPRKLSVQESAALPLVLITAWEVLFEKVNLQAGQTILIHGAAGGVGHVAVQLAHHIGARIAVTVGDEKKAGLSHALGAEKVIRYKDTNFVEEIMSWTDQEGVDVVFDTVGGETFTRSFHAVKVGGKIASILATPLLAEDVQLARLRNLTLSYELMVTPQLMNLHAQRVRQREILEAAAKLVENGELGVLVSHQMPLAEAGVAHKMIEQGDVTGKIILTM
jgi:NADPH2:quinone reductase